MSFDLFLHRMFRGNVADLDLSCVNRFLAPYGGDRPNDFGHSGADLSDGTMIEFFAPTKEGMHFELRNYGEAAFSFLYNLASVGDMVIFNAQGRENDPSNPLAILVHPHQSEHLPDGLTGVICSSGLDLAVALQVGFEEWDEYRRAAIERSSDAP